MKTYSLVSAVITVAVALCIAFVDRALALWLNARFYGTTVFAIGEFILRPLDILMIAIAVLLIVAVVWRRGRNAPVWLNRFVAGGTGAAIALFGAQVLKVIIGRSQVFPAFLQDHIYAFRPFAFNETFMGFPSATMAFASGFVAGAGMHGGPQRAAAAVILIVLALALLVTSGHWLGDIIGGTYLGVVTGVVVARRLLRMTTVERT